MLRPCRLQGERMYSSYSFLIFALDGLRGNRHASAALYPRERTPGTHWTGGWVVLELVWTRRLEEKSFASAGYQIPVIQSVVRHYTDFGYREILLSSACCIELKRIWKFF
jgi:hypothetical protein